MVSVNRQLLTQEADPEQLEAKTNWPAIVHQFRLIASQIIINIRFIYCAYVMLRHTSAYPQKPSNSGRFWE